jgi:dihydrofolate synthase/folylpolyglutamate synthase
MQPNPAENLDERYQNTIEFLYSFEKFGILLGLENISFLLEELGNPQNKFKSIHVAGSNGKGSTSSYINGILSESGFRTAIYTSPHLNDFRERVKLGDEFISKQAIVNGAEIVRSIYDRDRTTFFEITTAIAFLEIASWNPDFAVIEVGLGGRLDATNVIAPLTTIITDISLEHEDYLGRGFAAIAREKSGIIKPGVPLVTGASRREARRVIIDTAREKSAPVREFGKDFWGRKTGIHSFAYMSDRLSIPEIRLSMAGSHQIKNASIAIAAIEELTALGYTIETKDILNGIRNTNFPGRFEILSRSPDIVIDGAHTPEGMRLLKSTFQQVYPGVRPLILLGILQDKDYTKLVNIIAPLAKEVVCVEPQGGRALDSEHLSVLVSKLGIPAANAESIEDGFTMLRNKAQKHDVILAAGSLYMIGPVRTLAGKPPL